MEKECRVLYLGTAELISSIKDFFNYHKRDIDIDIIETIISNLILDVFAPSTTEGHLDNTLAVFTSMRMGGNVVYDFVLSIYNQLLFSVNTTRVSENLNYLDKINIDLITPQLIKITYDPQKKIYSNNTF